jgi:hypothetical protein
VAGAVPTRIQPITGWHSLFPASSTRRPIGTSHDALSQREGDGLTTFRVHTRMGRAPLVRR